MKGGEVTKLKKYIRKNKGNVYEIRKMNDNSSVLKRKGKNSITAM